MPLAPVLDALMPPFDPEAMLPLSDDMEPPGWPMAPELCVEPEFCIVPEDCPVDCAEPAEAMAAQAADKASKVMRFIMVVLSWYSQKVSFGHLGTGSKEPVLCNSQGPSFISCAK